MIQVVLVIRAISLLIFIPWNILADCIEPSLYSLLLSFLLTSTHDTYLPSTQHSSHQILTSFRVLLFFFSFFFSFVLFHFIFFFIIFFLWLNLTVGSLSLPVISLTVELDHLGYRCIGDWQPWRPVIPTFSLWFHFPSLIFFTYWLITLYCIPSLCCVIYFFQ